MSGLMRPVTAIELAANAAERWRGQYATWMPEDTFADGTTKASHDEALNSNQHTPENIARILTPGWAYATCDCCETLRSVVVEIKSDWGEDSTSLCLECIEKAATILRQFPDALAAIPRKAAVA